ncbi:MAG: hypothetical protein D8M59_01945 [Planctomycetes bacterium]|nr:hypothetical protein [Planctomycetota bacterium]NOG54518.1 hypothetical protein [Planctomycetota bacterium]
MKQISFVLSVLIALLAFSAIAPTAQAGEFSYWDASAEQGEVIMKSTYSEETIDANGWFNQRFEVKVWGARANTKLEVAINGHVIGVLITDETGFGKFEKEKFNVPPNNQGRPDGPRIDTGDIVSLARGHRSIEAEFMPR